MDEQAELDDGYDWGGDGSDLHEPVAAHVQAALVPQDRGYESPLDRLLQLGDARSLGDIEPRLREWQIAQEHVPDLIRMARDRRLNTEWDDDDPAGWAPIHALLALEHFDVTPFVDELVPLFDVESDWISSHLPEVLARTGSVALAPLTNYFRDRGRWIFGRAEAARALGLIGQRDPALRMQVAQTLSDELEHAGENAPELNGFLIHELLDLEAVEYLPVIRRAFEQDAVDEMTVGDWTEVLRELGQEPEANDPLVERSRARWNATRADLRARYSWLTERFGPPKPQAYLPTPKKKDTHAKQKHKRKMAKAARKANKGKKKK